jgi:Zn-dependent oligopeptidase
MGRDSLYELLGAVWLSDGEEYRERLVKEALKRGSGEERQRYSQIQQRKLSISVRLQEIAASQDALNLRDQQNVLPHKPSGSKAPEKNAKTLGLPNRSPARRRQEEAEFDARRQQYTLALQAYHAQTSIALSERLKIMEEFITLQTEYASLEETEKWLLLSMAIKNQSSLLGYMQGNSEK